MMSYMRIESRRRTHTRHDRDCHIRELGKREDRSAHVWRRIVGAGSGPSALTSSPAPVPLLEFAVLVLLALVVFQVAGGLLREAVPTDRACRDIEFAAAPPCGLLRVHYWVSGVRAGAWEKQRATFDSQCINLLWRSSQVLISERWRHGAERTSRKGSLLAKSGRSRKRLQRIGWVVLQG